MIGRATADSSSPTTSAPRSPRASTCRSRRTSAAGLSVEASVGYTGRALHQELVSGSSSTAMRSRAKRRSTTAPARTRPGPSRSVRSTLSRSWSTMRSCASTGNIRAAIRGSRPVQDPRTPASTTTVTPTRCPRPVSPRLRAGVKFGDWQISAFCDNLFDSHTAGQLRAGADRRVQSGRTADAAGEQFHVPPAHDRASPQVPRVNRRRAPSQASTATLTVRTARDGALRPPRAPTRCPTHP